MTKRINSVIKQVLFIACILLLWAEPGFSAVSRVQLVRDSLAQNANAGIQQHYTIYHDENLGFLNFAEALDQTAKGTQLKNDLLRNPENHHILEGLTSGDPELYAQAMQDLGHLAQARFGLDLSDITFYDAQQTTSLSLADTILNDVRGGAVAVEAMVLLLPEDELGQMQVPGFGEGLSPQETWSTILLMADVYESLRLGLGGKPATNAEDVSGTPGYVVNDEGLGSVTTPIPDSQGLGNVLAEGGENRFLPDRPLPRDEHGKAIPDVELPHTQLGTKEGRKGDYLQAREWNYDTNGNLVPKRDIDFTDHGRPQKHVNPHQHDYVPNPTGGTLQRSRKPKPLELP